MHQCYRCGAANLPGAKFCARCGQNLAVVPAPPKPAGRRFAPAAFIGGSLLLLLLLILGSWALFLRTPGGQPADDIVDDSGSVTILLPTATLPIETETSTVAPTATAVASATPLPPEATPTLAPLKIPGTDIEVPRITDEEEVEIGREIAAEVEAELGLYHDATQLARVAEIGRAIIPHADRAHLPYTFALLDTDEINAFAVPGGFIYVTRGMLDFVRDDDELAGVIGHEIAHVARRHGADRLEAFALAVAAGRRLLEQEPRLEDIYATEEGRFATEMTAVLLFNGWSRQNEFEADEYGVIYMARAGYDPQAVLQLFNRMESVFAGGEGEEDALARLLSTHPPFPDRMRRLEEVIATNNL
jgi:beta-barrel assembly-enhancing protease